MSIHRDQLENIIIRPSLSAVGLLSDDAVALLMGTAAQETKLGSYIAQVGISMGKGGIGIYQCQKQAYDELWELFVESSKTMKAKVLLLTGYSGKPPAVRMASDLVLATIMARLFYARILKPLPSKKDVKAMGEYWKRYYNTQLGKGTVEEFMKNYQEYVAS